MRYIINLSCILYILSLINSSIVKFCENSFAYSKHATTRGERVNGVSIANEL